MKRIWNVRLNVDEWNAGIAGLDDDADRVRFLSGFNAGVNGKPTMDKGHAWEAGWKVGNSSHLEAIKFSDMQRGKVMKRYHGNTTVAPRNNHGSTVELPIDNLQSTIEESTNDNPTIQQSKDIANALAGSAVAVAAPHVEKIFVGPMMPLKSGGAWQCDRDLANKITTTFKLTKEEFLSAASAASLWLETNPGKKKTVSGMGRFLTGWMKRSAEDRSSPEPARPRWNPSAEQRADIDTLLAGGK